MINHAIYKNISVYDEFDLYTSNFIKYAKTRNTDFKVLYIILYDDDLRIVNYLNKQVNVSDEQNLLSPNNAIMTEKKENLTIMLEGADYVFKFNNEPVQFKALIIQ